MTEWAPAERRCVASAAACQGELQHSEPNAKFVAPNLTPLVPTSRGVFDLAFAQDPATAAAARFFTAPQDQQRHALGKSYQELSDIVEVGSAFAILGAGPFGSVVTTVTAGMQKLGLRVIARFAESLERVAATKLHSAKPGSVDERAARAFFIEKCVGTAVDPAFAVPLGEILKSAAEKTNPKLVNEVLNQFVSILRTNGNHIVDLNRRTPPPMQIVKHRDGIEVHFDNRGFYSIYRVEAAKVEPLVVQLTEFMATHRRGNGLTVGN